MNGSTIIALATPATPSAIHVIRASGPRALAFLCQATGLLSPDPRRVYTKTFRHHGRMLDRVVCFWFKAPASYTGEDLVEIQCHGSASVSHAILKAGLEFGLEPAPPGGFTRRAVLNGKLSLGQAEAVDVLVRSRSEGLRDEALRILEGRASLRFSEAKELLVLLLAELETSIEFPEDQPGELFTRRKALYAQFDKRLAALSHFMERILSAFERGKKLDEGIRVALVGRPNAGKSTLMNALLREERVLVSPEQGTTRDYIGERLDLGGIPVLLFDTAGLRPAAAPLEAKGIQKTLELLSTVDVIILLLYEPACLELLSSLPSRFLAPEGVAGLPAASQARSSGPPGVVTLLTKVDLCAPKAVESLASRASERGYAPLATLSLLEPAQLTLLEKSLGAWFAERYQVEPGSLALLTERQRQVALTLRERLASVRKLLSAGEGEELLAEELHMLRHEFGELDLEWGGEEVLDALFSRFCIGK